MKMVSIFIRKGLDRCVKVSDMQRSLSACVQSVT